MKKDVALISRFEKGELSVEEFHHFEHVKIAWLYFKEYKLIEVLEKYSNGIKRFAQKIEKERLYHETKTWAYLFLIYERMKEESWEEFINHNPDLFDRKKPILNQYYSSQLLNSEQARKHFCLPDLSLSSAFKP